MTLLILALIIGVTAIMSRAFERLHDQVDTLTSTEMENLMTSVRLVQQAESLINLGLGLSVANSHAERRQALINLTDRTLWVNQLTARLAQQGGNPDLINQVRVTQAQLRDNITELNELVSLRIDAGQQAGLERQINSLSHNNRELAGQLAVLMGYFSATMRQQMVAQSEQLATDIHVQQRNLIALALLLLVFALLAGVYFEVVVVRRILQMQRNVSAPVVDVNAFDTRGGDEISSLAKTVRSYVQRIQYQEARMREAHQELTFLAEHDALTGLANRRHFQAAARRLLRQSRQPLCVAIGDIDHFKQVNDRFGHAAGDQVLVEVSRQLSEGLRESDILARFGGEEFAIILPAGSLEAGHQVLDKLRSQIATKPFSSSHKHEIHLSMSFGLVLIDATPLLSETDEQQIESLLDAALRAADKALYAAKRQGRNQVAVAPETVYAQAV
ncbi:diguanylate cyclase [Marinobacterium sp. MBR-109]|uniref:GGDEF domain-containing protein n=1 Tax=Marinobacterium sp. MBR-109 TaxID=3156462 RepID=UPI00339800AE